jgi:hypothetical protein
VENEYGRRGREDHEELDRLLVEADRSLGNEALKRVGVRAASMWGQVGRPALPGHTGRLVGLLWKVQKDLGHREQNYPDALRKDLKELRSRFELEARRDAGKTAANGGSF